MSFPSPAARFEGPLPADVVAHVEACPLAWVASSGPEGPNVAPKEIWTVRDDVFWFAVIASPTTVGNVQSGSDLCVAAIDIWTQRGHKFGGRAEVVAPPEAVVRHLNGLAGPTFELRRFVRMNVDWWSVVIGPSQRKRGGRSDQDLVREALSTYLAASVARGSVAYPTSSTGNASDPHA